jgi:hypothetical protein
MCAFRDEQLLHGQMLAEIADVALIPSETSSQHQALNIMVGGYALPRLHKGYDIRASKILGKKLSKQYFGLSLENLTIRLKAVAVLCQYNMRIDYFQFLNISFTSL